MIFRALCLVLCLPVLRAERLPLRIYTTADGLAGNTVDRIVRDSRGYLWLCTRDGLSRFDGYQFKNFGEDQGLPAGDTDLLETPAHDYWVATSAGIAHFRPADTNPRFEIYLPADLKARAIQVLAADPGGGIWAGTAAGLYHLDPPHPPESSEWQLRRVDIGLPTGRLIDSSVEALLIDRSGTLWAGARSGLYRRFPDGKSEGTRGGLPHPEITALLQDREGQLWAGTWARGVCRIRADGSLTGKLVEEVCAGERPWAAGMIHSIYESSDGVLWASSTGLSAYFSPGSRPAAATYTARNGLPGGGTEIHGLTEDRAGNLWAGSDFGAIRIAKGGFRTYSEEDGLDARFIGSIFEDRSGALCVITGGPRGRLVNRFDGSRFYPIRPDIPRAINDWGWSVGQLTLQARNGEWWVPTGMGVFRFPPVTVQQLAQTPPRAVYAAKDSAFALFEDSRGGTWISTQILSVPNGPAQANGVARWDPSNGILRQYSDGDGVPSQELATAFAEDRFGSVWIGLNSGSLLRYSGGRFQTTPLTGKRAWVRALHFDRDGRLWIASSQGVIRIDPATAAQAQQITYTIATGLASNDAQCITEDLQGRIYVGTSHGVDRISPGPALRIRHYTTADGLAPGGLLVAFRDRNGVLWFGSREGLSRLEPEPDEPPSPPPVFLSGLRVRGAARPVSALGEVALSGLKLGSDQNQIELEFVALGFRAGETLRYQYQFQGLDSGWSPPTELRTVNYASLEPGSYRWQVRALTADGIPSEQAATLSFTVLTPLWQRWWVRLSLTLSALAILYALFRYRLDRQLEVERLRTRIATDLHDDIGSTLSQIAILSEVANRRPPGEQRSQPISDIADLARELVDSMGDIVWAIDPEQERLGDLSHRMRRFANDLFNQAGVTVRFSLPGEEQDPQLGPDIRRQVFLIFKEGLHNIARHSACSEVEIHLHLAGGWLELAIADNGKGFDTENVRRGHGLASMSERAEQLGGVLGMDSAFGLGTSMRLRVPLTRQPAALWKRILHKWIGKVLPLLRMLKGRGDSPPHC